MSTDNLTGTLSSTGNLNGTFGTSGGGGTSNYNELINKPQINGNTLEGNKTTEQLGINIPDMSNYYNKSETNTLLDGKADASDIPDISNYYNKTETDALLDGKADTSDLPDMSNYYNKTETDTLLDGKVNNSSFNAASMPITSGSAMNTKAYIDKIAPVQYQKVGKILNSNGGAITGCGIAIITLSNGIARIDFSLMIETADETSHSNWGINRDYFTSITGKTITPTGNGSFTYYKPDGTINADRQGYGGTFVVANQFWKPARVYKSGSDYAIGSWADTLFPIGTRINGVCYGTYT